jgi:hypothetical protein
LLKKNWTKGIRQKEVIEKLNLTKPTVYNILKELISEHKIYKLNNFYYPEFDDDFVFGYFISDYISFFLTELIKRKETMAYVMPNLRDFKLKNKNPLRDSLFGFANVIGALITYVLIESSAIYGEDLEFAKTEELIKNIFNGIIWRDIFYHFQRSFRTSYGKGQIKAKNELNLSESLMNVYPRLFEISEDNKKKYFREWVKHNPRDSSLYKNCHHEWRERNIFKCGKFDECIHCRYQRLK